MENLEDKMMDALIMNRVEFVDLLSEKGVNMKEFVTKKRLDKLFKEVTVSTRYNTNLKVQKSFFLWLHKSKTAEKSALFFFS